MLDTISVLIIILIILNIITFGIGYIIGKLNIIHSPDNFKSLSSRKNKHNTITENNQNKITIDDRKFVTSINTEGIEKKYTQLGDTKIIDDNITESVNKLQNLKR